MATTWMIVGRVIRVAEQAQAEQSAAEGETEAEDGAQAEQAAVGEAEDAAQAEQPEVAAARAELEESVVRADAVGVDIVEEPGIIISVEPPPRVTFLTARLTSLPSDLRTDMYPYIIASGPFCLLAHFATTPYCGTNLRRSLAGRGRINHLVVVRHFRRAGGQIAATAVHVPARPRAVPRLNNIESVGLVCDTYTRRQRTYTYMVAELMVDTGRTNPSLELVIFRSDCNYWFSIPALKSPLLDWDPFRRWVPHGAVAVHSTVMWFDLSWGILSCDVEQQNPKDFEVFFYRLPRNRGLRRGGATEDIHTKRCIAVSGGLLRYVEIITIPDPNPNGQAAMLSMWSLQMGDDGWRWIANYSVRFEEIWNNDSYALTGLQPEIPVLAGVCPANPDVVYFDLHHRLFGMNVPERRVVDYEANQHELVNVPEAPLPQKGSSRYLLTWNLLGPGREVIGHVEPDLPEDGFPDEPKDKGPQDPKGKSKATEGRRKSTSASSSRPSKAHCIK